MTEKSIRHRLGNFIASPRFRLNNLYVFGWESDLLFLTTAGYFYEIEIKISRGDFFNDKKKTEKTNRLHSSDKNYKPNYFYYAVPENLILPNEVPSYAGLIYITEHSYTLIKKAPKINDRKIDPNGMNLLDKFYFNMISAKNDAHMARYDLENVRKRTKEIFFNHDEEMIRQLKLGVDHTTNKLENVVARKFCPKYNLEVYRKQCEGLKSCDLDCEFMVDFRKSATNQY